jgi:hypothetical protein
MASKFWLLVASIFAVKKKEAEEKETRHVKRRSSASTVSIDRKGGSSANASSSPKSLRNVKSKRSSLRSGDSKSGSGENSGNNTVRSLAPKLDLTFGSELSAQGNSSDLANAQNSNQTQPLSDIASVAAKGISNSLSGSRSTSTAGATKKNFEGSSGFALDVDIDLDLDNDMTKVLQNAPKDNDLAALYNAIVDYTGFDPLEGLDDQAKLSRVESEIREIQNRGLTIAEEDEDEHHNSTVPSSAQRVETRVPTIGGGTTDVHAGGPADLIADSTQRQQNGSVDEKEITNDLDNSSHSQASREPEISTQEGLSPTFTSAPEIIPADQFILTDEVEKPQILEVPMGGERAELVNPAKTDLQTTETEPEQVEGTKDKHELTTVDEAAISKEPEGEGTVLHSIQETEHVMKDNQSSTAESDVGACTDTALELVHPPSLSKEGEVLQTPTLAVENTISKEEIAGGEIEPTEVDEVITKPGIEDEHATRNEEVNKSSHPPQECNIAVETVIDSFAEVKEPAGGEHIENEHEEHAEEVKPEEHVESLETQEAVQPTESAAAALVEPAEAVEPVERVEPIEPNEPIEPAEPVGQVATAQEKNSEVAIEATGNVTAEPEELVAADLGEEDISGSDSSSCDETADKVIEQQDSTNSEAPMERSEVDTVSIPVSLDQAKESSREKIDSTVEEDKDSEHKAETVSKVASTDGSAPTTPDPGLAPSDTASSSSSPYTHHEDEEDDDFANITEEELSQFEAQIKEVEAALSSVDLKVNAVRTVSGSLINGGSTTNKDIKVVTPRKMEEDSVMVAKKTVKQPVKQTTTQQSSKEDWETDEEIYIYTSLANAQFNLNSDTNRMSTILQNNRIEFQLVDLGTNERAKKLWKWRSKGKKLPGIVRGEEILGNLVDLEEANEFGEVQEFLYDPYY